MSLCDTCKWRGELLVYSDTGLPKTTMSRCDNAIRALRFVQTRPRTLYDYYDVSEDVCDYYKIKKE